MIAPMQKRTFLLMEILIALFLVSLCIIPLIGQPLRLAKNEFQKLELMEKERLADWIFSEVKEMFLKNEIPWEKIPELQKTTGPFFMPAVKIQFPGCKEKKIPCKFTLWGQGEKTGVNGEKYRHIYVRLFLEETKYEFRLPIQKLPS